MRQIVLEGENLTKVEEVLGPLQTAHEATYKIRALGRVSINGMKFELPVGVLERLEHKASWDKTPLKKHLEAKLRESIRNFVGEN